MFCGAVAPFKPERIVQAALIPILSVVLFTFWNAPPNIGYGKMFTDVAPASVGATTTKSCKPPVLCLDCGLTAKTPAILKTVPAVSVPVIAAVARVNGVVASACTVLPPP